MIKNNLISSLELLSVSKPRVTLILKDLIRELIYLSDLYVNDEGLKEMRHLCSDLKNKGINDVIQCVTGNIVDYNISTNNRRKCITVTIDLFFQRGFAVEKLRMILSEK